MDHARKLHELWNELEKGDEEAIHEARKLTRKAQAYLRATGAPRKTLKPWKRLRQTIAPFRDLDVTLDHLKKLLRELQADPVTLELLSLHYTTQRIRMWAEVELPVKPRDLQEPKNASDRVQETLEDDWQSLRKEARKVMKSRESAAWHTWRKHLKRYRYTWEIEGEAPAELIELLKHLGHMQDMEVLKEKLEDAPEFLHPYLPELREVMTQQHDEAQRKARELWQAWSNTHQVLIES
ncbi:CHAD domain-containing protein [Deinococcus cellulosilyticus]|uniref:CHAD domain-containing protein n=1 Tax=Deinococcus cellulosilyticus (strain DSM 18568 / NBRC 106333 / KACC 11606 / 5516J-15) TaxID=1223518 RepID=A0A511N559_DEIC1|nr:CHAD domain-containing protein [Deinococcus cellulosilyticus]GEM47979.1 CHAD domain-containing protein [Deinococcus cellulosilyticus NBRC 106333 = KACC 11606]